MPGPQQGKCLSCSRPSATAILPGQPQRRVPRLTEFVPRLIISPPPIRQAVAATNSLYTAKGLEFHTDVADDLPLVSGDRDRLVQVVINLISNAVKFTERGHVACSAKRGDGPFVSVSVSDTGIGIAPSDQAEVFDKFRQVGDTLTEKPSGTGLGLPICREIVEHLGGSITVESMLGYGSTFTFQLPTAKAGASPIDTNRRRNGPENRHSRG